MFDLPGFESMPHGMNSLDTLLINYAHERLAQHFVVSALSADRQIYLDDGIEPAFIKEHLPYGDNAAILKVIDGDGGIFSRLTEVCGDPSGTDHALYESLNKGKYRDDVFSDTPRVPYDAFVLSHWNGDVEYRVDQFRARNREALPSAVREFLRTSREPLVVELFADDPPEEPERRPSGRKAPATPEPSSEAPGEEAVEAPAP